MQASPGNQKPKMNQNHIQDSHGANIKTEKASRYICNKHIYSSPLKSQINHQNLWLWSGSLSELELGSNKEIFMVYMHAYNYFFFFLVLYF